LPPSLSGDIFKAYIKNQGTLNATAFRVSYHLDDVWINEWFVSSLKAGQMVSKSFAWIAVEGSHSVKVYADSYDDVEEIRNKQRKREVYSDCSRI
jgi:subtilase family serine protease